MKSAEQWADELCNKHILNIKGQEIQDFIREIQDDAIKTNIEMIRELQQTKNALEELEELRGNGGINDQHR